MIGRHPNWETLNNMESNLNSISARQLKLVNQSSLKNTQYLDGSNGHQLLINSHGTLHSDSPLTTSQLTRTPSYWEIGILLYSLEMRRRIQLWHSPPIHIQICMEMVIQPTGRQSHTKLIWSTGIMCTLDSQDISRRPMVTLNS